MSDPVRLVLGLGRVLRPVLSLMGRYRAASVVSVFLAVGWLVVGMGGDARAAGTQPRLQLDAGRPGVCCSDLVAQPLGTDYFIVAGTVFLAVALGTVALARALRNGSTAVRGGAVARGVGRVRAGRVPAGDGLGVNDGRSLGSSVSPSVSESGA